MLRRFAPTLCLLSLFASAHAQDPDPRSIAIDGVAAAQSFKVPGPNGESARIDWIAVAADDPEAALRAYEKAVRDNFGAKANPYQAAKVVGLFESQTLIDSTRRALDGVRIPRGEQRIYRHKLHFDEVERVAASRAAAGSANRRPAGDEERLARLDLLRQYQENTALFAPNAAGWQALGDQISAAAFDRSLSKYLLVGLRGTIGGVGTGWSLVMANAHPEIILAMTGVGASIALGMQTILEWLGNQYMYAQWYERRFVNGMLAIGDAVGNARRGVGAALQGRPAPAPRRRVWVPGSGALSSEGATMAKWAATEQIVNTVNRLAYVGAYQILGDAKVIVDGVAQIPDAYRLPHSLMDTFSVTAETVLTQGVYENVINSEFVRRTTPYHTIAGYYFEQLANRFDAGLMAEMKDLQSTKEGKQTLAKRIAAIYAEAEKTEETRAMKRWIDSAIALSKQERAARGLLANFGSATWVMNIGLKGSDPVLGTVSAFSLAPTSVGLKFYYEHRRRLETQLLRVPSGDLEDAQAVQKVKKGLIRAVGDYCRGLANDARNWYTKFKSEIQLVEGG